MIKVSRRGKTRQYPFGVTAIIRSLGGGGAERVLTSMLNYWAEQGRCVTCITTTDKKYHAYQLHKKVRCVTAPIAATPNLLDDCPWDIPSLRNEISKAGNVVVISFMEKSNIAAILATSGLPVKLIISERTDPRTQTRYSEYKQAIIRRLYPLADALVVQTSAVKGGWADAFMPAGKVHIINNAVTLDYSGMVPDWLPANFLCGMGRLTDCKGFNGLVDVFSRIVSDFPTYKLVILGEGPGRKALQGQIGACGLTDHILLPGFIDKPHTIVSRSSLFVLPSLFEGYPNALIEAMALGVPCVSFDCPSGPSEIIAHNQSGILVPTGDYPSLERAVVKLLRDAAERKRLGENARTAILTQCDLDMVMAKWDDLINGLLV